MADVADRPDVTTAPHADEIFARPAPVDPSRTRTREVLAAAVEMIATTTDDLAATVIDIVARELATVADRLATYELLLSESQAVSHAQHVEITRLRARNRDLLDLARGPR